jgi:YD repeat-containing protein
MDTTGFYLTVPQAGKAGAIGGGYTIYDSLGNQYSTSNYVTFNREDTNRNLITLSSGVYTDTLGRSIATPPNPSSAGNTDSTGCAGPLTVSKAVLWQVPAYNGTNFPIKFCYAQIAINIADDGQTGQNGNGDGLLEGFTVLQAIVLPNAQTLSFSSGTAWEFEYNDQDSGGFYGTLTKVTLPTGGSISYTYQLLGDTYDLQRAVTSRTVSDGSTSKTWTYTYVMSSTTTVTAPKQDYDSAGNDTVYTISAPGKFDDDFVTGTSYYQGTGSSRTLLKSVAKGFNLLSNPYWTNNNPTVAGFGPRYSAQVVTQETATLSDGHVSQRQDSYDPGFPVGSTYFPYGSLTQSNFYDYGSGAPGPLMKQVKNSYYWQTYSNYLTANLLTLSASNTNYDGGGNQIAQTTYGYDENNGSPQGVLGNQTSVSRWLKNGTAPKSQTVFNTQGMPTKTIDPNLNATLISYDSTGMFPSQIQHPDTTSNGAVVHHIDGFVYDVNTGVMTSHTDQNLLKTSFGYDSIRRLTSVANPDGGSESYSYNDAPPTPSFTFTKAINPGSSFAETGKADGLGRVIQKQLTSDPQGTVYTDTTYDALGRVYTVSNPHRTCGSDATSSCGSTTYSYDALSRKISESYSDGSVLSTAYCGPSTLVTDPAKRWRRSRVDGLGHLVEVDEPNTIGATVSSTGCPGSGEPIWITTYTVDAVGNLTNVVQNGSHQRSFTYDSLSRLLCSSNPENSSAACPAFGATSFPSGTVSYAYDAVANVITKKDARLITVTYSYDALNRELSRTYNNGDPSVTTIYDQSNCLGLSLCQNIGARTSMSDAAGSEAWSYQVTVNVGTTHVDQRTTNSITKTSTYYLDFAKNVTQVVYPTGRIVNYHYDAASRPNTAADGSNGITYASGAPTPPSSTSCLPNLACYTPQGSLYAFSIGQTSTFTGINTINSYNSRLQPLEFKASSTGGNAMDITYNFVDSVALKNAGHVNSIVNNLNSSRTQNFTYDQVNRITSAGTSATTGPYCWGFQYSYDPWGNLQSQAGWSPTYNTCSQTILPGVTADGNNHITTFAYDPSGNTTNDGSYAYTWNGESQLTVGNGVTYQYDGDGRRVAKVGSKLYWYGSGGEILGETDSSGSLINEYVFFGGRRIARIAWSGQ